MPFKSVRWYRYSRALKKPLTMMGQTLERREGLLLRGTLENSDLLWSEAAPLPGLHTEALEDVLQRRNEIGQTLLECDIRDVQPAALNAKSWPVTARFAAQALWLQMQSGQKGVMLHRLLAADSKESVNLNGLATLPLSKEEVQSFAKHFREIKIKVGRAKLHDEADAINALLPLPEGLSLKLDANRSWSLQEALVFSKRLKTPVAYIEEPLRENRNLEEFFSKSGICYALDESLNARKPAELKKLTGCAALVLKPSLHGIFDTMLWANAAAENDIAVVISSVFESAVGLNILAHIAAAFSKNHSCGMDTARFFKDDVGTLDQPTPGTIRPQANLQPDMSMLQEVK